MEEGCEERHGRQGGGGGRKDMEGRFAGRKGLEEGKGRYGMLRKRKEH
jgi:hypothetical protein